MKNETIKDFHPYHRYKRNLRRVIVFWVSVFTVLLLFTIAADINPSWVKTMLLILLILILVASILVLELVNVMKMREIWNEMDYSGLKKRNIDFTTKDGIDYFAYLYTRKDVDLEDNPRPRPTIIGIHGYAGHHRIMDRYCLPIIREDQEHEYMYFTFDARGHGQTPGDMNDFKQYDDLEGFLDLVKNYPGVDKDRICVVAMSLGCTKAAVLCYPDPDIKLLVLLSGMYDIPTTMKHMGKLEKIYFKSLEMYVKGKEEEADFHVINEFKPEGIILHGDEKPTPNERRIFLIANKDDRLVNYRNSLNAARRMNLPPKNYRIYDGGSHNHKGNEWLLGVAIYSFVTSKIDE
mgnify:CR=1 FL=1